jgi:hypothetical protein
LGHQFTASNTEVITCGEAAALGVTQINGVPITLHPDFFPAFFFKKGANMAKDLKLFLVYTYDILNDRDARVDREEQNQTSNYLKTYFSHVIKGTPGNSFSSVVPSWIASKTAFGQPATAAAPGVTSNDLVCYILRGLEDSIIKQDDREKKLPELPRLTGIRHGARDIRPPSARYTSG